MRGRAYDAVAGKGLDVAKANGVEIVDWAEGAREQVQAVIDAAMASMAGNAVGDSTIGEIMALMKGD